MDVKTLCLGLLSEQDRSGYEIKRYCEEVFRHFFVAGFGSIYPALAELRRAGLVRLTSVEQQRRPAKKVYALTEAGRTALVAELLATAPAHKVRSSFLTLMYFAHLLPPAEVDRKLAQMIEAFETTLEDELVIFGASPEWRDLTPGQRFALGYGRTVLGAALAYCRAQRPLFMQALQEDQALHEEEPAAGIADTTAGAAGSGRAQPVTPPSGTSQTSDGSTGLPEIPGRSSNSLAGD